MTGFGSALADGLAERAQADLELARGLAAAGADVLSKTAELARAAADAMMEHWSFQTQARLAESEAGAAALSYAGRKLAATGVVGATAVGGTGLGAAGVAARSAYDRGLALQSSVRRGYEAVAGQFMPERRIAHPCQPCLEASSAALRKQRIEKRQQLIQAGERSSNPDLQASAARLRSDMHAVELARLSANSYTQYDPNASPAQKKPPEPWKALSPREAQDAGINPKLLENSKAVIYQLPPDFPLEPKTVVAFRGTTLETEDILTDHDQALGLKTRQYEAARDLGKQLQRHFPNAEVTGHSLGGGKAQAAGVAGRLKGAMFNAAGLHPRSVGLNHTELARHAGQFSQYRAAGGGASGLGDPLTALQNSTQLQALAYGSAQGLQAVGQANRWALKELGIDDPLALLPARAQEIARGLADRILNVTPQEAARNLAYSGGQWHVPPALGEVLGVTSVDEQGNAAAPGQQHGIGPLINGLEQRKAGDIDQLLVGTGLPGPASAYIGPHTRS